VHDKIVPIPVIAKVNILVSNFIILSYKAVWSLSRHLLMEGDRIVSWTYQSDYLLQSILWNPLWVSKVVSCESHDWLNGNSLATPGIATCHITSCHCTTSRHVNRGRLVACRWMTLWVAVRNVVHWRVWGRIRFNGSSANDRFLLRKVRGGGRHCLPNECTASSKKFYFCRRQNGAVRSLREPPARTGGHLEGKKAGEKKLGNG